MREIRHLYVSAGHNYFGRHGQHAGTNGIEERSEVRCVAGRGIEGDRFFSFKDNYKGQITFFAEETHLGLCEQFGVWDRAPSVYRRNVITRGIDLNQFIGRKFEFGGVTFAGAEECRPCAWMDDAFHAGAEAALRGRGGLRARILSNGMLRTGAAELHEV